MKEEGFEEWDADFLDQLVQVEELALSRSVPNPNPNTIPITSSSSSTSTSNVSFSFQQQQQQQSICYSPPRELSQKPTLHFHNYNNDNTNSFSSYTPPFSVPQQNNLKDQEIDRLKKELEYASKKLSNLEQECSQLRTQRNNKVDHFKFPTQDNRGAAKQHAKALETEVRYQTCIATSSSKAIGVQTDGVDEVSNLDLNGDLPSQANLSDKLLGIWGSVSDQQLGKNMVSKMLMACPEDFHFLFGHMGMNVSSKLGDSVFRESSSNADLQCHMLSFNVSEAEKVSNMYSVLTKISNGLLHLEALLGPLLDLCHLENVDIVCSSLKILHAFLKHLLWSSRKLRERDSVKVEGAKSGNNFKDRGLFIVSEDDASFASYGMFGIESSDPQILCKKGLWNAEIGLPLSCVNWVSLFEFLHQIAISKPQEHVILEAVSIMNFILLRANAHSEREIFGQAPLFDSIAQFLKREAGSDVQKKALHMLYLLLNCPKLLSVFHSGCKEGDGAANGNNNASNHKGFSAILEGLADCIACSGNNIKDIELRKRAVIMLAYLASVGRSGFEILVHHRVLAEKNFLLLILQLLISELDVEVSIFSEPAENIKARISLMREALILLNRLVSNPGYSAAVLQVLTSSREMASSTINIATRLSQKDQILRLSDNITQHMRESEIVDLARVLKKRVFTYLGDKIP